MYPFFIKFSKMKSLGSFLIDLIKDISFLTSSVFVEISKFLSGKLSLNIEFKETCVWIDSNSNIWFLKLIFGPRVFVLN